MKGFGRQQNLTDSSEDTIELDANDFGVLDEGADGEVEVSFQPAPHPQGQNNVEVVPDYRTAGKTARKPRRSWTRIVSVIVGLSILLAVILLIVFFVKQKDVSLQKSSLESEHPDFQGTVTAAELPQHASSDDCWLAIHGNVYDLTEYALEHPGGPEYITDFCGMDATSDYAIEHPESLLRTIRASTWLGVYDENTATAAAEETGAPKEDPPTQPETTTEAPPAQEGEMEPEAEEEEEEQEPEEEEEEEATPFPEEEETPAPERVCLRQFYNLATVAEHDSRDDCWYILYGLVYDLTDYVDRHPGGARRVFNECGTDATQAYEDERWHDRRLLRDEGMSVYIIGEQGDTTGLLPYVCND